MMMPKVPRAGTRVPVVSPKALPEALPCGGVNKLAYGTWCPSAGFILCRDAPERSPAFSILLCPVIIQLSMKKSSVLWSPWL